MRVEFDERNKTSCFGRDGRGKMEDYDAQAFLVFHYALAILFRAMDIAHGSDCQRLH